MNERDASTEHNLDPQAYLERMRFAASRDDGLQPTVALLRALHEAHLLSTPFENLSIHYHQPVVLREHLLFDKIVRRTRGGFCYELNGLFAWLLRRLGFEVTLLAAGVAGDNGSYTPEFDHLTLRVSRLDGADWLADVGFGDSFRRPLRLVAGEEQDGGDGYRYRLRTEPRTDGDPGEQSPMWWILERTNGNVTAAWQPQYRFSLTPHALADFEPRCHFQQTAPDSHFIQRRLCSLALPNGRITLSDLRLFTTLDGQREERDLASEAEYHEVLAARFGIVI